MNGYELDIGPLNYRRILAFPYLVQIYIKTYYFLLLKLQILLPPENLRVLLGNKSAIYSKAKKKQIRELLIDLN